MRHLLLFLGAIFFYYGAGGFSADIKLWRTEYDPLIALVGIAFMLIWAELNIAYHKNKNS